MEKNMAYGKQYLRTKDSKMYSEKEKDYGSM